MVGLAVHKAVQAAQLGVMFVALNERIVDVQTFLSCRALSGWLGGGGGGGAVLTLHKFEPLESALRAEEAVEDENNVRERAEGKPLVRHKHAHARANRLVREHVEAGLKGRTPGWQRASTPTLACRNRTSGDPFFSLPGVSEFGWQSCWLKAAAPASRMTPADARKYCRPLYAAVEGVRDTVRHYSRR